jgi:hypothetical protein
MNFMFLPSPSCNYEYRILMGTPEGKVPLERHRRRSKDNIEMDLRAIGWGGME